MRIGPFAITCLMLSVPGAALAESSLLDRPDSCTPVLTVQALGCTVETTLRCDMAGGPAWRTELHDASGVYAISIYDANFVPIQSLYPGRGIEIQGDMAHSSGTAPAEIAATGHGTENTAGTLRVQGKSLTLMHRHNISRIDPPLVLDGTTLIPMRIKGFSSFTPPLNMAKTDFMNYFEPVSGALVSGESLLPGDDGKISTDGRPAAVFLPGQPGFDSITPTFDCINVSSNDLDEKVDFS